MSQRYQREIEEILEDSFRLKRSDQAVYLGTPFWKMVWLWLYGLLLSRSWSQPERLVLVAVLLLVSSLIIRAVIPVIAGPVAWAGLLLFVLGYAMFFIRPRPMEQRRRGQHISNPGQSWWERIWEKIS